MGSQANKAIVQEFYDQWNSGAIDFERLVHPGVTNHQPDREPETGLDDFRQAIETASQNTGSFVMTSGCCCKRALSPPLDEATNQSV